MKRILSLVMVFVLAGACFASEGEDTVRLITLEEHFTAQEIIDENGKFTEIPDFYRSMVLIGNSLMDAGEERLAFMDGHKIDMQVLSYTSPVSDQVPAAEAVRICRRANDILAEVVKAHPDRFAAFATLPMADPEEAAKELERCVKELGFVGALIAGQFQGHFYEEKQFFPIFAKAAELDVPISFHPAAINQAVQDFYYSSPEYSQFVASQFASAGFGWHVDVGIHEVRMILSGIFDKLPNLKLIAGHWGEAIPSYLERMDYMLPPRVTGLKKKISDYYKENFYITPGGILSSMQFEYMVKLMGADHILWAVDYPYIKEGDFYGFIMNADFLTAEDKELIMHKNAEKLLHLNAKYTPEEAEKFLYSIQPDRKKAYEIETQIQPMLGQEAPFKVKGLYDYFLRNPQKALQEFDRKRIDVQGVVLRKGPDPAFGQPSIELSDMSGEKCYVLCVFQDAEAYKSVKPGDTVSVRGNYLVVYEGCGIVLKISELI